MQKFSTIHRERERERTLKHLHWRDREIERFYNKTDKGREGKKGVC